MPSVCSPSLYLRGTFPAPASPAPGRPAQGTRCERPPSALPGTARSALTPPRLRGTPQAGPGTAALPSHAAPGSPAPPAGTTNTSGAAARELLWGFRAAPLRPRQLRRHGAGRRCARGAAPRGQLSCGSSRPPHSLERHPGPLHPALQPLSEPQPGNPAAPQPRHRSAPSARTRGLGGTSAGLTCPGHPGQRHQGKAPPCKTPPGLQRSHLLHLPWNPSPPPPSSTQLLPAQPQTTTVPPAAPAPHPQLIPIRAPPRSASPQHLCDPPGPFRELGRCRSRCCCGFCVPRTAGARVAASLSPAPRVAACPGATEGRAEPDAAPSAAQGTEVLCGAAAGTAESV